MNLAPAHLHSLELRRVLSQGPASSRAKTPRQCLDRASKLPEPNGFTD